MRKERWTDIGLDGNIYMVFREPDEAWDYAETNYPVDLYPTGFIGRIACFGGYENAVCIQAGIGM